MWCECWDTDDDDYYSWIDANYIDFYDERPTKQTTTVTITHTAAVTDTTTVTALFAAVIVIIIAISALLIVLITKKGKVVTAAPDMSSVKAFNNRSNNNINTQIDGDLFCVNCGKARSSPDDVFCPNCGTQYNNQ